MRITTVFIVGMFVAALVPAAVIGVSGWWVMRGTADQVRTDTAEVLLDQAQDRLQHAARERAAVVSQLLRDYHRDVILLRQVIERQLADPSPCRTPFQDLYPEHQDDGLGMPGWGYVHPLVQAYGNWDQRGWAGNPWVRPDVVVRLRGDPALRGASEALLRNLMHCSPALVAVHGKHAASCDLVWVVTTGGVNLTYPFEYRHRLFADPSIAATDEAQQPYVRDFAPDRSPGRQGGWTSPYFDAFNGKWMTSAVEPVYRGDEFIGTVGADVLLNDLGSWLQGMRLGGDGYLFMLSAEGLPLAMPAAAIDDLVADRALGERLRIAVEQAGGSTSAAADAVSRPLVPVPEAADLVRRMTARETLVRSIRLGGADKLVACAPIVETGWSVGLVQPRSEVESGARAAHDAIAGRAGAGTLPFILVSIAVALLTSLAGAWIGLRLVRPVRDLTALVGRIGQGGRWEELPPGPGGELATLAVSVNRLVREVIEHQGRFRVIFDGVDDAIMLHDLATGRVIECNRRTEALLGYTPDEMIGRDAVHFCGEPPYSAADALAWIARAKAGENPVFPWLAVHRSGRRMWVEVCLRRLSIAPGEVVVAVVRDIGERMAAQEALHRSKEEWERTFDAVPDWVAITDRDGGLANANRAMLGVLGQPLAALRGRPFHRLLDLGPSGASCPCHHLDPAGPPQVVHLHAPALDRHLHLTVSALVRDGEVFGSVHVLRDVTEAVRLEERLRQSARMDAIGQLAGGVAHDFNNQLTGILGFADLLSRRVPPELRPHAVSIATAAGRAADLTRQLLDFARRGRFRSERVDLHALIAETIALLGHSIDRRIAIERRLEAAQATVLGDASQLQNALLNLALNARDAMPDGGMMTFTTTVETVSHRVGDTDLPPGPYVRLEVADTGQGMDEAVQRRLFEPFFTTKGTGKGTGLGLASVYGTVRSHQGAITVSSTPGRGSVFAIYLPVAEAAAAGTAEPRAVSGRLARVLVIDDEAVVRDLAVLLLEDLGHQAVAIGEVEDAIARFAADPGAFDLVILDLMMPQLTGREVLARLRAIAPRVRVLIASGFSLDGDAQAALDEGARGFLQKPFLRSELAAGIEAVLDG